MRHWASGLTHGERLSRRPATAIGCQHKLRLSIAVAPANSDECDKGPFLSRNADEH